MSRIRNVAVLTTSRADYGLLYWLLKELAGARAPLLQLLVCGSHLSKRFGRTVEQIRRDGFVPAAEVPTLPREDTPYGVASAVGRGAAAFAGAYRRLKPDILVVLGDRYELLAACSAAVAMRLPIAHIHGGESTEGVIDEQIRHAVTKMSHLHFVAAEPYRRRVIAMGEQPSRVFDFGAPGLEYLRRLKPASRRELEVLAGPIVRRPFAVMTYHPGGGGPAVDAAAVEAALRALKSRRLPTVATYANADAGGGAINDRLRTFSRRDPSLLTAVPSLGQRGYLSLLGLASVVIGNSSSGIIEAPSLGIPTVNIGDRQAGRLRSSSVVDCGASENAIRAALSRALSPRFLRTRCTGVNVYGNGRVAAGICAVLRSASPRELLRKSFYEAHG